MLRRDECQPGSSRAGGTQAASRAGYHSDPSQLHRDHKLPLYVSGSVLDAGRILRARLRRVESMNRIVRLSLVLACLAAVCLGAAPNAAAWDKGNPADYHERRAKLMRSAGDGVVVMFGYSEDQIAVS